MKHIIQVIGDSAASLTDAEWEGILSAAPPSPGEISEDLAIWIGYVVHQGFAAGGAHVAGLLRGTDVARAAFTNSLGASAQGRAILKAMEIENS